MSFSFVSYIWPVALVYFSINGLFFFFQKSLLFFPEQTSLKSCSLINGLNIDYYEKDKVRFIRKKHPNAKANLVLFHGNAGSACHRDEYFTGLENLPINIILAEYPGYSGDIKGELSEESFLSNAQQLLDELHKEKLHQ